MKQCIIFLTHCCLPMARFLGLGKTGWFGKRGGRGKRGVEVKNLFGFVDVILSSGCDTRGWCRSGGGWSR